MKNYKNEIALGTFTLVSAAILGYMTLTVGKFQFGPTTRITAVFDSASGVVKDAVVMVAGVEVGHVDKIELRDGRAVMHITLNDVKISKNVKAVVRAKSLLGEKYVEFVSYKSSEQLKDGDEITNTVTPVEIDQLVTTLGPIMLKLGPVLEKVNPEDITNMFTTLSKAFKGKEDEIARIIKNTDELLVLFSSNEEKFTRVIDNVDALSSDARGLLVSNRPAINRIVTNTDKLMKDFSGRSDLIAKRVDLITANIEDVSRNFQKNSPAIISRVDAITTDLRTMTGDFRTNAPDLARKVGSITNNLDSMLASLNKEAPELGKELSLLSKDLGKLSAELNKRGPRVLDNADALLVKLVTTLNRLEPVMVRLEKFDDKEIIKEVERVMRQVGIKVNLF